MIKLIWKNIYNRFLALFFNYQFNIIKLHTLNGINIRSESESFKFLINIRTNF